MILDPTPSALLFALVALACGLIPPVSKLKERWLHAALAAATGIFLGAVFLDLLPSLSGAAHHGAEEVATSTTTPAIATGSEPHHDHVHADHETTRVWFCVLFGLLAVYLFESLALRTHDSDDRHRHRSVAWAALIGLSLQALVHGVELSVDHGDKATRGALAAALFHRGAEAFALATIFVLAGIGAKKARLAIVVFAILTPLGLLIGRTFDLAAEPGQVALLTGFAAGIFLFVSLCELLPEVFHHSEDGAIKIALLGVGIAAVVFTV